MIAHSAWEVIERHMDVCAGTAFHLVRSVVDAVKADGSATLTFKRHTPDGRELRYKTRFGDSEIDLDVTFSGRSKPTSPSHIQLEYGKPGSNQGTRISSGEDICIILRDLVSGLRVIQDQNNPREILSEARVIFNFIKPLSIDVGKQTLVWEL